MSERKKILWLASWYPGKHDPFDGDFIQRHARAAAIFHDIHVIFVRDRKMESAVEEEWNYVTGLTEQIIYFRPPSGMLSRMRKFISWRSLYQKAITKYIIKNGKPDCVHVHIPWNTGLLALWLKKKYALPFLITEHWGIYNQAGKDNFYTRPVFIQNLVKKMYSEADKITTVSAYLASGVKTVTGRESDMIIPNVVDTTLFFHKEEKYSKFTFIHVSNMVPVKNAGSILEAFQQFTQKHPEQEMQLLMIGNKDDHYAELAKHLGLLNVSVFFMGEVSYTEVAEEMRRSHCLVLFSDSETFSCVTAEALCSGLPVVATQTGALPELVSHHNGRLVEPGNLPELMTAMEDVWQNYSSFNAARIATENAAMYGYSSIAEKFDRLYGSVGR